jgi:hypothetical protein
MAQRSPPPGRADAHLCTSPPVNLRRFRAVGQLIAALIPAAAKPDEW